MSKAAFYDSIEPYLEEQERGKWKMQKRWTSRKFLTGVISFVVLLVNQIWGIELDTEALIAVVLPIVTYIISEGVIDAKHK